MKRVSPPAGACVGRRAALLFAGALVLLLFLAAACDSLQSSPGPPVVCVESGVQCQLETGPLGVCERAPCPAGGSPPCFRCTPQH